MKQLSSWSMIVALVFLASQLHELNGLEIKKDNSNHVAVGGVAKPTGAATVPILYHAPGPVMPAPVIYVIWYGTWSGNTGVALIEYFLKNIGAHPWWGITKAYNNTANVVFGKSAIDSGYSYGKVLT